MSARVGINQITLAEKGTALTTPVLVTALGLRPSGALRFTPIDEITDYRNRKLRNRMNAEAKFKTFQPTFRQLKNIIDSYIVDLGADVEILAVPQSSGADGGCFQFFGSNALGVDFIFLQSNQERSLEYTLQRSFKYNDLKTIIDASDSNTPVSWGESNYGINTTKLRTPWLKNVLIGGSEQFLRQDFIDYSIELKPEFDVNLDNIPIINYINAKVEFTSRNATIPKLVSAMGNAIQIAVTTQEDNTISSATYDKIVFNSGVLFQTEEIELGDDSRFIKMIFEGKFPVGNMAFTFGTGNGDSVDALGQAGGTLTISL